MDAKVHVMENSLMSFLQVSLFFGSKWLSGQEAWESTISFAVEQGNKVEEKMLRSQCHNLEGSKTNTDHYSLI